MKNYTVYMHISPSNKRYIGITSTSVDMRWNNGHGYKDQVFHRAIKKYGWDNIQHIIIAKGLDEEEAKWLEVELIREFDTTNPKHGYNVSHGGEGGNGLKHTEEWKQEHSRKMSGENNPMYGRTHTEEVREKLKKMNTGENNPWYGKQRSEETKRKISESNKGKKLSEEVKQKISEKMSGKDNINAKAVVLLNTLETFDTIKEASNKYNISENSIINCCRGYRFIDKRKKEIKLAGRLEDGTPLVFKYLEDFEKMNKEDINKLIKDADTRVICLNTMEIFDYAQQGNEKYGCGAVSECCKGRRKSSGKHPITGEKLVWMYYQDYLNQEKVS